jgi:hypothetical protein
MTLETLSPEVLATICSYSEVACLSVVSKRIRAVTLKFILRSLRVSFPGDRFEAISGFLKQAKNSLHVRTLVLDAEETDKATWQRLIEFLDGLTGLKSIECRENVALSLLTDWGQLPDCELFVRKFQMRGGLGREDYELDPKFRLLSASRLTSLECDVSVRDLERASKVLESDEEEEYSGEDEGSEGPDVRGMEWHQDMLMAQAESLHIAKVVAFLTSVVPNLKRLELTQNYLYGSIAIPTRHARRAKLVHLDLSCIGNPQHMLFKHLQTSTDFEVLESLLLPGISERTHERIFRNPMSLPRLKELEMYVPCGLVPYYGYPGYQAYDEEYVETSWSYIRTFLMNLPPLKKLKLIGGYNYVLGNCLEYHSTLERLTLHGAYDLVDLESTVGIDPKLLERIVQCESLTFLDIQVHRSRGDDGIWKILQQLRLETLILTMDCLVKRFDSTFENRKEVLECAATDAALVRSIYDIYDLEYLRVTTAFDGVQAFHTEDLNTVRAVLQELTGSFEVKRVEGRARVVEIALEQLPVDEDALKFDSEIMNVFESTWPSKGGSWKDDWHSLPLALDT